MAEQYGSFQGREPNIDVNLFTNARSQGIAAGNAQSSIVSSIVQGGIEGAKTGMAIQQGFAQLDQTQAQTKLAEAQTAALEQKTANGGGDAAEVLKNRQAQEKLGAMDILKTVGGLVDQVKSGNTVVDLNSTFGGRLFSEAARVDPDGAYQALLKADQTGRLDPQVYDAQAKQIFAVKRAEQDLAKQATVASMNANFAAKTQQEFEASRAAFSKYPGALDVTPNNLELLDGNNVVIRNGKIEQQTAAGKLTAEGIDAKKLTNNNILAAKEEDGSYRVIAQNVPDSYRDHLNNYVVGANIRPVFGPPTVAGVTEKEALSAGQAKGGAPAKVGGGGLADRAATSAQNMNTPVQQAVQDATASLDKAIANGVGTSWTAAFEQAKSITRGKQMGTPGYLTPQSTPTPIGSAKFTLPVNDYNRMGLPAPTAPLGSKEYANQQLSNLLGGVPVELNVDYTKKMTEQDVATIEGIPALQDMPAILKGQAFIESGGKIDALSAKGAAGLLQIMPGTAADLGLTAEQRIDPRYAVPAAVKYMKMQYSIAEKALDKSLRDTGSIIKPDPRMVLASYNGGAKWVQDAIRAGNTDWDSVKEYIKANKSAANAKENIEYVDKVIAASIPFIKGGNTSDDSYVHDLINFDIVTAYQPSEP